MPRATPRQLRELGIQTRLWVAFERRMLRPSARVVAKHMRLGAQGFEDDGDVGIQEALHGAESDWINLLTPNYLRVGRIFGQRAQASLLGKSIQVIEQKQAPEYEAYEALLMSWIETQGVEQAVNMAAATKSDLRNLVAAGRTEQLSNRAIASSIRKAVPDISRVRAQTIARTEVHNAAGYANHHAAISLGISTEHKWIAHPGERTRDTHLEADAGEWLPLNEPFIVGDWPMKYPGDSSGGAGPEEIVNCRCGELQRAAGGVNA